MHDGSTKGGRFGRVSLRRILSGKRQDKHLIRSASYGVRGLHLDVQFPWRDRDALVGCIGALLQPTMRHSCGGIGQRLTITSASGCGGARLPLQLRCKPRH